MPLLMHPFFRNIQLFSKIIGPSIHDPVKIGVTGNVVFIVLFNMNFSRGEPVDCFTLGNIPQIGQIFFRNVKGITHSGGVPRRVPGVAIDTIKGVAKIEGIQPISGPQAVHCGKVEQAAHGIFHTLAELIAHIKSGPIFKPAQLHIIGIQLFHDFFTLAEGGIHPTAQAVTPALDGTSKIRTEDGINGRSQRLKHGKNSVRQIEEQAANCPNRIIEYISDEVCNGSHKVIAYSMYLIGLMVAILVAAVIHLIDRKTSENYLLIELPEYKAPSGRTVAIYVWEKVKDYLTKAGTTIFMASILMWVILNFGPHGYTTEMTESFGAILGHWLVPFFAPVGLGFWQIAVALIAGISAKEVVVSSCAVLFGVPNINSEAGMNTLVGILGTAGFGQLNAFCLMIFCLLYIPCAATLATIRKEAASTRWMLLSALFQLVVAWAVTFVVYRVGLLL